MSPKVNIALIAIVLAAILIRMSVFTVDEREHAIKLRFGEIVRADYVPGLHLKVPFINNVLKYQDRILNYDDNEERFLTGEKKNLIVDYFVTWRIANPGQYYRAVRGDEQLAIERLRAIVTEGIKASISRRTVQEVVSAERSELLDQMLIEARTRSPELGIEVVDVRVKRIELSEDVSDSVFNRMRQERRRTAAQLRAEGEEEYERIQADAERQRTIILSEAYRDAERIRGEGDASAADIYAQAYSQDSDFYAFYRSMAAYRQAIGGEQDILVLEPDSDFFRFLQQQFGGDDLPQSAAADAAPAGAPEAQPAAVEPAPGSGAVADGSAPAGGGPAESADDTRADSAESESGEADESGDGDGPESADSDDAAAETAENGPLTGAVAR